MSPSAEPPSQPYIPTLWIAPWSPVGCFVVLVTGKGGGKGGLIPWIWFALRLLLLLHSSAPYFLPEAAITIAAKAFVLPLGLNQVCEWQGGRLKGRGVNEREEREERRGTRNKMV
ncbi:hypothetical protein V8C37DRAFT_393726 [Trichoderma ceciliae]